MINRVFFKIEFYKKEAGGWYASSFGAFVSLNAAMHNAELAPSDVEDVRIIRITEEIL